MDHNKNAVRVSYPFGWTVCDCVGVLGVCPQYQFCYFLCKCSFDPKKNSVTVNSVKVDIIFLVKKDTSILYTLIFSFFFGYFLTHSYPILFN
jgi:hypothetical protein